MTKYGLQSAKLEFININLSDADLNNADLVGDIKNILPDQVIIDYESQIIECKNKCEALINLIKDVNLKISML